MLVIFQVSSLSVDYENLVMYTGLKQVQGVCYPGLSSMEIDSMQKERFTTLVVRVLDELPLEFQNRLENVDVVVMDWPTSRQLSSLKLKSRGQLLGLYEGVPQTKRGRHYGMVVPDKITIFQKPIEMAYRSDRGIMGGIGKTVRHEIAHHFGISDERLSEIAWQKRSPRRKNQLKEVKR